MRHEHDSYGLEGGDTLRMVRDKILVRLDPTAVESEGGLHLPSSAMEHPLQTGTILAFGWQAHKDGTTAPIRDLTVGDKCVFLRFIKEQHSNQLVRDRYGKDVAILGTTDIMLTFEPEDHDRVLR